jgi:L-2-hydroxyglutarate oxidase LhgO
MPENRYDIAIIGGGIIGCATAMRLVEQYPRYRVVVIEKETKVAAHQSGHNSGVIHSGIYYAPGSLKARNCVTGVQSLLAFCDENGIKYELCGKVIVATSEEELPRLDDLHRRGMANGVPDLEMIDRDRLRELEPHATGLRALLSPKTGIIDYAEVSRAYAARFEKGGGDLRLGTRVIGIERRGSTIATQTDRGDIESTYLINCAGLYSDAVAKMMGLGAGLRIVPFRGEYYFLKPEAPQLVRTLIYPVPDPGFPFLGVHFTRTIHGGVEAGPNAVLALAREGYTKTSFNPREALASLAFGGFWGMARRYWKTGVGELYRSLNKSAFTTALQRLVPEIRSEHLDRVSAEILGMAEKSFGLE